MSTTSTNETVERLPEKTADSFKENLLQNAKYQVTKAGGKVRVIGKGDERKIRFYKKEGQIAEVWFPVSPRVGDVEIDDLQDCILEFSGHCAFAPSVWAALRNKVWSRQ